MTISEQVPTIEYTANGATTTFAYSFLVFNADSLVVQVAAPGGAKVTQTLGVDYTFTGIGDPAGGVVAFAVAPVSGAVVNISRDTILARGSAEYRNNADLTAARVGRDLDSIWLAIQELYTGAKNPVLSNTALQSAITNGLATYSASEVERLAGVPPVSGLALLLSTQMYPRPFALYQSGGIGDVTQVAATWSTLTASNNAGNLRISSAGVHGLSGAAVGRSIYLSATSGIPVGLYKISAVPNTTTLDFAFGYVATVAPVALAPNTSFNVASIAVPAGCIGPNGSIDVDILAECTGSVSSKYVKLRLGAAAVSEALLNGAAEVIAQLRGRLCNQASQAAQRNSLLKITANYAVSSSSSAVDTAQATTLYVAATLPTVDEYIRFSNIVVRVTPAN